MPHTYNELYMNLSHIEHIGIAVKSLENSIPYWEKIFGLKCYSIEEVAEQKVKTAFFKVGQTKIELLESTDPEGPIGKFIEKKVKAFIILPLQSIIWNRRLPKLEKESN